MSEDKTVEYLRKLEERGWRACGLCRFCFDQHVTEYGQATGSCRLEPPTLHVTGDRVEWLAPEVDLGSFCRHWHVCSNAQKWWSV